MHFTTVDIGDVKRAINFSKNYTKDASIPRTKSLLALGLVSYQVGIALVRNAESYIKPIAAFEDLEHNVVLTELLAEAVAQSSSIAENELGDYVLGYMVPLEATAAKAIGKWRQVKATETGVEGAMKDRLKKLFDRINHALTKAFSALNDKLKAWVQEALCYILKGLRRGRDT